MQLMDHPPARRCISVVLVTLIFAMVSYSQGQDVVTLPVSTFSSAAPGPPHPDVFARARLHVQPVRFFLYALRTRNLLCSVCLHAS